MSDELPVPQPTEEDEQRALATFETQKTTALRGHPTGTERCDNCHFFADTGKDIAFCWHDKLEILAGRDWWCDRWAEVGSSDEQMTDEHRQTAVRLQHEAVEDNVLVIEPKYGERCDGCLYYLNPDDSVSYCWHPKVRIAVGDKWWCQWWEDASQA